MSENLSKPAGFQDASYAEIQQNVSVVTSLAQMMAGFGYETLATPLIEYVDSIAGHLDDTGRMFRFTDFRDKELALRYDLTAPLVRYVSENVGSLSWPFRSMRAGTVFRDDKPGPGRFRVRSA